MKTVMTVARVPAGSPRPARRGDRGAAAVEAAVMLLALALLLAVLVWFLAVLGVQLRANDAARAAARLAARAQPYADVRDEARRIAPGVSVDVAREAAPGGTRVIVVVRQRVSPPLGPFSSVGSLDVSSRASALLEQP
jgi:Flp pilus assembly protein TadG